LEGYNLHPDGTTPSFSGLSEMKTENLLETVLEYHRRGFIVTPLHGKKPILKHWQQRELSDQEISLYFDGGRNVGIVLGGPAGLVDVDLDNPVAITVGNHLLPTTIQSGREKSPHSHCWYVCNRAPASRRYTLPKAMADRLMVESGEATLVELRSTGRQTVVAPSVHPVDGYCYIWHQGEIRTITGEVLAELILDVGITTVLVLNIPLGSRQHFIVHAASYLSHLVDPYRAEAIVGAASSALDDEEHDERMWAVRNLLCRPSGANPPTSIVTVAELERLAPGVPALISRWCERGRRDRGG
jgi:hypothetical protein